MPLRRTIRGAVPLWTQRLRRRVDDQSLCGISVPTQGAAAVPPITTAEANNRSAEPSEYFRAGQWS